MAGHAPRAVFRAHLSVPGRTLEAFSTVASVLGRTADRIELVKYFLVAGYQRLWGRGPFRRGHGSGY